MGYSTDFWGEIKIEPPLSSKESAYLEKFANTRRVNRERGPYYVEDDQSGRFFSGKADSKKTSDVLNINEPPEGQPGLWCQWVPSKDGSSLRWDGGEKFYKADVWMTYLIEHFLCEHPYAKIANRNMSFLNGHVLNGVIYAIGEEMSEDLWKIEVKNSRIFFSKGSWGKKARKYLKECEEADEYIEVDTLYSFIQEAKWEPGVECKSTLSDVQRAQRQAILEKSALTKVLKSKVAVSNKKKVTQEEGVLKINESSDVANVNVSKQKKSRRTL